MPVCKATVGAIIFNYTQSNQLELLLCILKESIAISYMPLLLLHICRPARSRSLLALVKLIGEVNNINPYYVVHFKIHFCPCMTHTFLLNWHNVYLFSAVPLIRLPETWCRTCRQQAQEGEAKHLINTPNKVQTSHNLFFQLQENSKRGMDNVYIQPNKKNRTDIVFSKKKSEFKRVKWYFKGKELCAIKYNLCASTICQQRGWWVSWERSWAPCTHCTAPEMNIWRHVYTGQRLQFIQSEASWNVSGAICI